MKSGEERWPIAKDIALAVVLGLLVALGYLVAWGGPFMILWAGCSAGIFIAITIYHTLGPLGPFGATCALATCGGVAGFVMWLLSDRQTSLAVAVGGCAALVLLGLAAEFLLDKLSNRSQ